MRAKPYSDIESLLGKTLNLTFACEGCLGSEGQLLINKVDILTLVDTSTNNTIKVRAIRAFFSDKDIRDGFVYHASGVVAVDSFYLNPGYKPYALLLRIDEIQIAGQTDKGFLTPLRDKLNNKIKEALSPDSGAFVKAIVTGQRSELPYSMREAFNRSGLAHILSISGTHFGLLLFITFNCLKMSFRLLPERLLVKITLYTKPTNIAVLLTMPLIVFYLLLSSMSYPAVRAFIMITLFLIGLFTERKRYLPQSLMLAALIILLIEPEALGELSFQLSFLAVISIGAFLKVMEGKETSDLYEKKPLQGLKDALRDSLAITFAATLGTSLLVAYHFHYFSIISPVSNLLVTPLVGFVILSLALFSSMTFLLTGWFPFVGLIDLTTNATLAIVVQLSELSWASTGIGAFPLVIPITGVLSVLIAFYAAFGHRGDKRWLMGKITAIILLPYVLLCLYLFFDKDRFTVTFLDVGQGDASVVELTDGRVMVVDTGKNGYALSQYLRYRGIKSIDALVISHPHSDHGGGVARLLTEFKVSEIWDNGMALYPQDLVEGVTIRHLSRGDRVAAEGYNILALHPHEDYFSEGNAENNHSLVLKISLGGVSFLFTGDIERDAIDDLNHTGPYLNSDVLKFPHHGGRTSLDMYFIKQVSPEFVVLSVGRLNPYGFPHRETLEALNGLTVFRTDRDGAIRFRVDDRGQLIALTYRDSMLKQIRDIAEEWANIKRLFYGW